jgi:hypothetical protein
MSLGYSVMLLKNVLRDIVYMLTKIVDTAYLVHEMKILQLYKMNLSDREMENHRKLHEIQLNNIKKDIVISITKHFPKSFNNIIEFNDWDSMMKWIDKELKINKEVK